MKNLLLFLLMTTAQSVLATEVAPSKDHLRYHVQASVGSTTFKLPSGSYNNVGTSLAIGYFLLPKLSINGHYFMTPAASGSSNLNGLGLAAKYYFYNTETSFELKQNEGRIRSYDRYFAYSSFQFVDREVRTSRINVNYTGFGLSLGAGYKIDFHNSIGIDVLQANLKSASGSISDTDATFTNLSVFYSYNF